MSTIPYNYGKYIDDKVSMSNSGTVDAGRQAQSPASAGSRGLAKTTQFTKDPTQMKMGNSPIAESMVEIRNILNRIDGVNVPTNEINELADDDKIEFTKVMLDISQIKDRVEALSVDEEAKKSAIQSLTNAEEALVALDETQVQEDDGLTQAYKQIAQLASDVDENPEDAEDQWELASEVARPITKILKQIMDYDKGVQMPDGSDMSYPDVFKKVSILANKGAQTNDPKMAAEIFKTMSSVYDMKQVAEESVSEDEDELGRLKELSGIEEDDNESKYYEYTGKGFAIRPSGQSVWADKADIPSVINVESIMISHYPDMDDYVELTMEHDGPWEIYTDKAVEAALEKTLGMPSGSIKWSEQGQQEEGRAHFDVASTAIGKVSGSSMFKQAEHSYESFPEADELARLKELSGIEEDAGLTDQQKKGLEAIAKKYKDREGGNGDMLAYGYLDAYVDTGITTDGYDSEEMEVYSKKIGKNSYTDWEGDDHSNFVDQSEITSAMIDDLEKVLGPEFENDAKLSSSAMEYLNSLGSNYEPMPEGDEFDIEEDEDFEEVLGPLGFPEDETELFDAEYRGRKVPLNKPMRGDVKKFKVYVKDPKTGNVKKVNFGHGGSSARRAGQKTMKIRKSNPKARKSFRARHNCANPGPKTKARYWSCRKW